MLDLVIEGATVIDGTGAPPRTEDVGIADGCIREVGRITSRAREHISAHGAWLTPGFVDLHTHYDGQASWDETFNPSIHHGVTTVVFGNTTPWCCTTPLRHYQCRYHHRRGAPT